MFQACFCQGKLIGRAMLFALESHEERMKKLKEKKDDEEEEEDDQIDKRKSYFLKSIVWLDEYAHTSSSFPTWIQAGRHFVQYFDDEVRLTGVKSCVEVNASLERI
jgi:hypothetical protein